MNLRKRGCSKVTGTVASAAGGLLHMIFCFGFCWRFENAEGAAWLEGAFAGNAASNLQRSSHKFGNKARGIRFSASNIHASVIEQDDMDFFHSPVFRFGT